MLNINTLAWRDQLILTRDLSTAGERSDFFAQVQKGNFVSLRRGVYVRASEWDAMDAQTRYRARIRAVVAFADRDLVLSHHSAASLWRLPWFGSLPHAVHVLHEVADGGRSSSTVARHAVGIPRITERIEGMRVTSLGRTVVDLCAMSSFAQSVVVADAALRRSAYPLDGVPRTQLTREDLRAELALVPVRRGSAKARRVVEFADGAADRPGESLSRVNISLAGLTMPRLQVPLKGASGRMWTVDFWWEEFNLIGEFDGKMKYTDPQFLRGRTPEQAVYDEKLREDDLRAAGHGMTRWPWAMAISMPKLRNHLVAAGVR